ncbi:uncharacterized protein HaLaN_10176 [Haematococcus lacustris]|uniref:Chorismate-utilising enzyme C-terminal domain-containing protein n=1 Tax=Haematococcus lacustris TaxID=44745 RepID=A0A699ZF41_HAELA|nr:uncharacterized protein HaLaN_10176 [Haematococcus lacustris]
MHLSLYNEVVVFDQATKIVYAISWVHLQEADIASEDSLRAAYHAGATRLRHLAGLLTSPPPAMSSGQVGLSLGQRPASPGKSNVTKEEFLAAVQETKEHIAAGDIFQLVLSQRFERRTFAEPFEVYRALRVVNPSPYMVYMQVAVNGSVVVEKLMEVERYSHVMHISSTVTGTLLPHLDAWDALRAALPAGTVSGAPKVRAMQIIDELEVHRRGPYGGGIGHVSFTGSMDMALGLRTMVVPTAGNDTMYMYRRGEASATEHTRREWVMHLQAGAGLVADSQPESEYEETVNKAAALGRAIDLAEAAFVTRSDPSQQ